MSGWWPGSAVQVWRIWARLHVSMATRAPFFANAHQCRHERVDNDEGRAADPGEPRQRRRWLDFGGEIWRVLGSADPPTNEQAGSSFRCDRWEAATDGASLPCGWRSGRRYSQRRSSCPKK